MKANQLYKEASYFEFSKGDSHQMVFDPELNQLVPAFNSTTYNISSNFEGYEGQEET